MNKPEMHNALVGKRVAFENGVKNRNFLACTPQTNATCGSTVTMSA